MGKIKKLLDEYRFSGFRPLAGVKGKFGDNKARVIRLARLQKKLSAAVAGAFIRVFTTGRPGKSGICQRAMPGSIWSSRCGGSTV
jgi:hypothetical protein